MRLFINILLLTIISACSSMQNSNTEGEYRYVPITEALKKLSDEEVAIRLRTASLTCENDMFDTTNFKKGYRCVTKKKNISCDCHIEHVLHTCVKTNITVAHMTWTKGHWFMAHPGGMGWVQPGPETVFAHGVLLKGINKYYWEY